ncbi:MAG: sigma-70 family RNA polymerase sigma factor [Gammaproteobacteria bacterium]|nr:sigma-70 family RNA polymerase sigma factor [Gammaproteobacteria bacterium]MBV9697629.1 sigma-70 family RNA polymerase sigma factor [Gammaproteobacteria bacterium]
MLDQVTLTRPSEVSPPRRSAPAGDHLPDLLLIERARGFDEPAMEALVRRYGRRLFRVARSVLGEDAAAEAVVQEVYRGAFADLSRYEPTGKFAAWLTQLTYQQARALRALPRSASSAVAADTDEAQERRELETTLAALPEVFRTVFLLRVIEGISGIETAASLGVHETTVRTRLYRAHRRLGADTVRRMRALQPALHELAGARLETLAAQVRAQLASGGAP